MRKNFYGVPNNLFAKEIGLTSNSKRNWAIFLLMNSNISASQAKEIILQTKTSEKYEEILNELMKDFDDECHIPYNTYESVYEYKERFCKKLTEWSVCFTFPNHDELLSLTTFYLPVPSLSMMIDSISHQLLYNVLFFKQN